MTDMLIDPTNNIEIELEKLYSILLISARTVARYTAYASDTPKIVPDDPQPFQFQLQASVSSHQEDTKRKITYLDKGGVEMLFMLGSKQQAMLGHLESTKFPEAANRQDILPIDTTFVAKGIVLGYAREFTASLDAQNEDVYFKVTQSVWALPLGNYRMYIRAKDTAAVASDCTMTVRNVTDAADVATTNKTLTSGYAWYSLDFTIASGQSNDSIKFQVKKNTATANTISVDMIVVVQT